MSKRRSLVSFAILSDVAAACGGPTESGVPASTLVASSAPAGSAAPSAAAGLRHDPVSGGSVVVVSNLAANGDLLIALAP